MGTQHAARFHPPPLAPNPQNNSLYTPLAHRYPPPHAPTTPPTPPYQGRFKAFPIEQGGPLRTVRHYVQRNALTANLVKRAEAWRWGSLWLRHNTTAAPPELRALLCPKAPRLMPNWIDWINEPLTRKELAKLRLSVTRNRPFGTDPWTTQIAAELHLQHTLRPEGRPPKFPVTDQEKPGHEY